MYSHNRTLKDYVKRSQSSQTSLYLITESIGAPEIRERPEAEGRTAGGPGPLSLRHGGRADGHAGGRAATEDTPARADGEAPQTTGEIKLK